MSALREAGLAVNRALERARPIESPPFSARESCGRYGTASHLVTLASPISGDGLQKSYIQPPMPGILTLNSCDMPFCARSHFPSFAERRIL